MLPHLVDVHSVRVVSTTGVPERELRDIYGIIQLEDYDGRFDLYKEKRENPTKSFLPDGTLPLTGPSRYFDGTEFYVTLKLRERHDDGPDLDFGSAHHGQIVNHVLMYEDKPVRSVCRGKDGYSVIHFTAVSNGIQATVEVSVSLISNAKSHLFVYGSLVTRCRKYSYNTEYDRKYFRTTLYNVPEDEPKELEFTGFDDGETKTKIKIPLSRSVVPVPLDDQLIIEADFWVKPGAATATGISEHPAERVRGTVSEPVAQHVNGIVAFDVQSSEADVVVSKVIMVEDVSVEFKVIFSTPPRI